MNRIGSREPGLGPGLTHALMALVFATAITARAAGTNAYRAIEFREPHPTRYVLVSPGQRLSHGAVAGEQWTRVRREDGAAAETLELGSRVVLELEPGADLQRVIAGQDLVLSRVIRSNLFILQETDSLAAIGVSEALSLRDGVAASRPVIRRPLRRHNAYAAAPNDPFFDRLWHLENRGSDGNLAGPDLNIRAAWPVTRGEGVTVAVADSGVQLTHPELSGRVVNGLHYNFYERVADGSPYTAGEAHGTAVAGLIAAEADNSVGVAGVAPGARLASWVVFGDSLGVETAASEEQLMDMFQYGLNSVAVQNHSWGNASLRQQRLGLLEENGIARAITVGRGGKGVVMVRAAGNSRDELMNGNDDGYVNDPRAIGVAAVRKDGRACSYSNPGACILVGAPSGDVIDSDGDGFTDGEDPDAPGVLTTDYTGSGGYAAGTGTSGDYFAEFNGTSASAPQIAGVVALILSANTNLTSRDVQQVLLLSARHYDLADPDLRVTGSGLRFSHNVGFGVPDAAVAVDLAKAWSNRPAPTRVAVSNSTSTLIPDDALRVISTGAGLSTTLTNIRCLPTGGLHPDTASPALPLVYVGQANEDLTVNLTGKGALIQRGITYFSEKIRRAANAGASFAIVFNNAGATNIQAMGGTDYVPIPAVSINQNLGEALRGRLATGAVIHTRLQLSPAARQFNVTNTLLCEHVGIRIKTTHTSRQDVRVTLVSPSGNRSVMQAINFDSGSGPADWTYWSVAHFYESSAGVWRVEVSDQRSSLVPTSSSTLSPAIGYLTYAELIVTGVAITDTDRDGLDDDWEHRYFGGLLYGPKDDPDQDGWINAREQILGTNAAQASPGPTVDIAAWKPGYWRLSWPARESGSYSLLGSDSLWPPWRTLTNRPGSFPVSEWVVRSTNSHGYFRVLETPATR